MAIGYFQTTNLSLTTSNSLVTHTAAGGSPLAWRVHKIVSPRNNMTLRSDRWRFINVGVVGTGHQGTVELSASNGGPQDAELAALAADSWLITVRVRFNDGCIGDLPVQLLP